MLMCHVHHKLIDVDDIDGHPEQRLLAMKAAHERRIEVVGAIHEDRASHILRYAANIGSHESPIAYEHLAAAMLPERFQAEGRHTTDIELHGGPCETSQSGFWERRRAALRRAFSTKVREQIKSRDIRHLSVFGLAPNPC